MPRNLKGQFIREGKYARAHEAPPINKERVFKIPPDEFVQYNIWYGRNAVKMWHIDQVCTNSDLDFSTKFDIMENILKPIK